MDSEPSRLLLCGQLQHGARIPVEHGRLEVVEVRHEVRERPEHGEYTDPAGDAGAAAPRGFRQDDAGKVVPVRDQRRGPQPAAQESPGLRSRSPASAARGSGPRRFATCNEFRSWTRTAGSPVDPDVVITRYCPR